MNVDFADVKSIVQDAGTALMGIGYGTGDSRAAEAARAALDSPLLDLSISGAKGILFNISGGTDLSMFEVDEAARIITEAADPDANIIFGTVIDEKFGGEVPDTMEAILTLPGVARKTANVVLGNAFGIVEGIAVDTHVRRLSQKLGLTEHADTNKIEQDLMQLLPQKDWFFLTYGLIEYGRHICPSRKHKDCKEHLLTKFYPPAANPWP